MHDDIQICQPIAKDVASCASGPCAPRRMSQRMSHRAHALVGNHHSIGPTIVLYLDAPCPVSKMHRKCPSIFYKTLSSRTCKCIRCLVSELREFGLDPCHWFRMRCTFWSSCRCYPSPIEFDVYVVDLPFCNFQTIHRRFVIRRTRRVVIMAIVECSTCV